MKLLLVALSLVCVLQLALASCQWPMCRYQTMLKASDLVTGGDASRFNTADMGSLYLNKDFVDPDNYNFQGGWPLYRFVMMQRRAAGVENSEGSRGAFITADDSRRDQL
ncbi:hypothetical protein QR680_006837 [Steinernema hermaphroditum]|uniref:Uncharacterized protein n=1 Tax=Steinernema hermaphroditum TaxID=289476 RepID=A0AA39HZ10_9BILA|nr:hypothetical protein QR680_006837 [Steinernema hermaphroditum]